MYYWKHCNDDLMAHDLSTKYWATATPKAELTVIQEQVNNIFQRLIGATAPVGIDISLRERELVGKENFVSNVRKVCTKHG